MKDHHNLSRREFIQRLSFFGVVGASAGTLLAACGGGDMEGGETAAAVDECADLTGLTEAEVQMRETLEYVADSPYPEKLCDNCQFWQPAEGDGPCGGCQLIKGPINPAGYCNSWAAKIS